MPEFVKDAAIARAIDFIHRHYADDLSVEKLARSAGLSRTLFGQRFTAAVGLSPMRYCVDWRLEVAAKLLEHERRSASEIAYTVGFGSEAAFSRAFSRRHGQPPATRRRQRAAEATLALPAQVVATAALGMAHVSPGRV